MNVKITYTTDFDDVPYECWRLLDHKVSDGFEFKEQLLQLYKDLDQDVHPINTFEKIHQLRLTLSKYDKCLEDINNILGGWTQMRLQKSQQDVIVDKQTTEQDV
jgi:hypothetical protein